MLAEVQNLMLYKSAPCIPRLTELSQEEISGLAHYAVVHTWQWPRAFDQELRLKFIGDSDRIP
jgi:hypothetical protein